MSHYFYDDAFDFESNDGNFGYTIEKATEIILLTLLLLLMNML